MSSTKGQYNKYAETMRRSSATHYKEHREEILDHQKGYQKQRQLRAIELLGGRCVVCGLSDPVVLEFDHIHNDGAQHRRETGDARGKGTRNWIINNPEAARERLQLLCANCHRRKHSILR